MTLELFEVAREQAEARIRRAFAVPGPTIGKGPLVEYPVAWPLWTKTQQLEWAVSLGDCE